jgi:hypothetical protein
MNIFDPNNISQVLAPIKKANTGISAFRTGKAPKPPDRKIPITPLPVPILK